MAIMIDIRIQSCAKCPPLNKKGSYEQKISSPPLCPQRHLALRARRYYSDVVVGHGFESELYLELQR